MALVLSPGLVELDDFFGNYRLGGFQYNEINSRLHSLGMNQCLMISLCPDTIAHNFYHLPNIIVYMDVDVLGRWQMVFNPEF